MSGNVGALKSSGSVEVITSISHETEMLERFNVVALSLVPCNHFYPGKIVSGLLSKYNANDLELILQDFQLLKDKIFVSADRAKSYVVTAGGPGAGKSTYFESFIEKSGVKFAYIDPDRSCLLNMEKTYLNDVKSDNRSVQDAYTYWREASNFLANIFLAYALDQGFAVAHGSTMADPRSINALEMIGGGYGYHRTILHVTCQDSLRKESELKRREGGIVQCTDVDLVVKGEQFHERLEGYFQQSEEMVFLFRSDMESVVEYGRRRHHQLAISSPDILERARQEHDKVCGEGSWAKLTLN